MIGGLLKTTTAGGWPNARIGRGRRVYVGDSRDTLEQLLEGLQEGDTVDALLKGRLEEVSNILQDILEIHGGGGTEREALSEGPISDTGSPAPESRGDDSS
jgi:hypothetical protein